MGLTQLTGVLRALLREEVTTRHLDIILQTIAEAGGKLNDRQLLAEIRVALAPVVSAAVAQDGVIEGAEVEPLIDLVLGKAEDSGALVSADVVDLICQQIEALHREDVILVASKRARAYLRDIVRTRWSKISVVAQEEIASRFTLTSVGCIEVPTEEQRRALVATL
jgi:flagellar biosynthesis component FlhA